VSRSPPTSPPAANDVAAVWFTTGAGFYGSCLEGDLADANPDADGLQADCSVTEIEHPGTAEEQRTVLPACTAGADNAPCWAVEPSERCSVVSDHQLEVAIYYPDGVTRAPDTLIDAQCRTR